MIFGILPYVKITSLNRDAKTATIVCLDTLRLVGSTVKKISCLTEGVYTVGLCVSRLPPRKPSLREVGELGSNHAIKFSKGTRHHIKNRERKGPSQGVVQKCTIRGKLNTVTNIKLIPKQ